LSAPAIWSGDTSRLLIRKRLIRRDEWAKLIEATDVLQLVEDLQATAESSRNEMLRDATEKGYRDGLEQGRQAGIQELLVQSHTSEQFIAAMTERIVDIAELAVRSLVAGSSSDEILRQQLREVVEVARAQKRPRLLVSEVNIEAAKQMLSHWFPGGYEWLELQVDANLAAGDTVLECHELIVDGRMNARIDRWRKTVHKSLEQKWLTPQSEAGA